VIEMIDESLVAGYLKRLGLDREPPSVEALGRLLRAQVERIPYETMWLHMGEPWTVDPLSSVQRIVYEQRGGYCFHANAAFHELLCALGYASQRHVGTVHGPEGPTPERYGNHLALTVSRLTDSDGVSEWYVDAGLGDALYDVVPLREGTYTQSPMTFALSSQTNETWRLHHDTTLGSFTAMTFSLAPAEMLDFLSMHRFLATSPDSPFARTVTAQRRDASGVDIVRGLVLKRLGANPSSVEFETSTEWFEMLADVFHLPLTDVSAEAKQALWTKSYATHVAWRESRTANEN
jgi:N-hydroxyarylamine O-acetyltransferase